MKAIRYFRYGEPTKVLKLVELDNPARPGPNEVLIRVLKRPIHHGDLLAVRGRFRAPGDASDVAAGGATPGLEGMGVAEAVGPGVDASKGLRTGGRLAFFPVPGTWSELILAPNEFVVPLPDDIPDEVGSQLHSGPMAALMLMRAVAEAGLRSAQDGVVLLTAAGSNVARLVATLAAQRGVPVIGLVRRDAAIEELADRLPDIPVVSTEHPGWMERVREAAGGQPIRVALDAVGGAQVIDLLSLLVDGGAYVAYGDLSSQPISISSLLFPVRDITMRGVSLSRWRALPANQRREEIEVGLNLLRTATHQFRVAKHFPLRQVADAVRYTESTGRTGTVLLSS
jgi:NADPH:quinone reductase-like Zn-dependent oxidoreductase